MKTVFAASLAGATVLAQTALADVVLTDDHIFQNDICVGSLQCVDGELFGDIDLKVKSFLPQILLDDVSTAGHSWQISGDHADVTTDETFSIRRFPGGAFPFGIHPGADGATLWLGQSGNVGFGTALPQEELHLLSGFPTLRFETSPSSDQIWDLNGNDLAFSLNDITANRIPFLIRPGAPTGSLMIKESGNVGVGTIDPQAPLEVSSTDSFNFFRLTAQGAHINKSVDITFTDGPIGTGQLRYNIVDGDNQEMSLDANGNMVIDGTLTTAGPSCSGGCDRVFDADYALPSITERADQISALGHLPGMQATRPGAPVNLSEHMGQMLNELEHAHLYITQLHETVESERAKVARLEATQSALIARLEALEAE